jgi:tRNA G18 (ribose-2'-O)-methylase SpoU
MPIRRIDSLDDPLLAPYRNLKDKELARDGGRFIAEGENVVRRLLQSQTPVESVLVAQRKCEAIGPLIAQGVAMLAAEDELIENIIGFEFHSGVLACGIRPARQDLATVIPPPPRPALVAVCQEITNPANMGSLIRICAALGADAMVLGERCCDPYFRQSVRVSMGTIFAMPLVRSENLLVDLERLGSSEKCETWATVASGPADALSHLRRPTRVAVVFGNESAGLDERTIRACRRRVTIPMRRGTDSLNVAIASALFLYQLTTAEA